MRAVMTIAQKDLRTLFKSPLFYVIAGFCSVIWSLLYGISLADFAGRSAMAMMRGGENGGANVYYEVFMRHVSLVNFIMILATAALTMRLLSEEKRSRTYDLLLTSPITAPQIVAGKLLAGIGAAWALVAISMIYPLSLRFFVKFEWGTLLSAYFGLLLVVAVYVSLGLFASALTESPMLAVVMSLIFSVAIWFVGAGAEASDNQIFSKIFEHISVGTHFMAFLKGGFGVASLTFFATLILLCAFLTERVVESSRWR